MTKQFYQVIVKGSSFASYGPTPDRVISSHCSESAALKAFDRYVGNAALIDPWGITLASRIC